MKLCNFVFCKSFEREKENHLIFVPMPHVDTLVDLCENLKKNQMMLC